MAAELEQFNNEINPLDQVESILNSHNWIFDRVTESELMVEVAGKNCDYKLFFIWQEDMNALQFCAQYDMTVARTNIDNAAAALMKMNENLWMGHFDIPADTLIPCFRHTCLLRGYNAAESQVGLIEDLVDVAMVQCERYHSMFHVLGETLTINDQTLSLAMMETVGEA